MSGDGTTSVRVEELMRRVADCLETHLHEYGWEPYRYPSGTHKGVVLNGPDEILILSAGTTGVLRLSGDGFLRHSLPRPVPSGVDHE